MIDENYILVRHYCEKTNTPHSFIDSLWEFGLIECKSIETEIYLFTDDIPHIEKLNRMHNELGINLEGIDALTHMMQRMQQMEKKLKNLRNRLKIYE